MVSSEEVLDLVERFLFSAIYNQINFVRTNDVIIDIQTPLFLSVAGIGVGIGLSEPRLSADSITGLSLAPPPPPAVSSPW